MSAMPELKATPGPWSFTRYGYEKHAIADDRGTEIGFVHRARDARLIASAPELFEALERLSREADQWSGQIEPPPAALDYAWQVLAKAGGQS